MLAVASFLSSAALLGGTCTAMILGHWYLVIPGLNIKWLKNACVLFGGSIGFKFVVILISLLIGALSDPFGISAFLDRFRDPWNFLFYMLRLFIGLVLPATLCAMAYRAASIRAICSASSRRSTAVAVRPQWKPRARRRPCPSARRCSGT